MERTWLVSVRKNKNLSQYKVAKESNISRQYYGLIEGGDRRPSPEIAKKIAAILGIVEWYKLLEKEGETDGICE